MKERTVSIGAFQLGMLHALKEVVNYPLILERLPPVNVEGIVYGCLIQCGAEHFEIVRVENKSLPDSKYLQPRLSYLPEEKFRKAHQTVSNAFQIVLPEKDEHDEKRQEIWKLQGFLMDLLVCLERKTALATLSELPDPDQFEGLLPPELLFPVRNLLSMLEPSELSSPLPRSSLPAVAVQRFEEIISSDLFSAYSARHSGLESSLIPKHIALKGVAESGDKVFRRYVDLLQLRKLTLAILPITAKAIDTVFGKLPGALAEYFTSLVTDALKEERRIIVYQLDSIFYDLVMTRVLRFVQEAG